MTASRFDRWRVDRTCLSLLVIRVGQRVVLNGAAAFAIVLVAGAALAAAGRASAPPIVLAEQVARQSMGATPGFLVVDLDNDGYALSSASEGVAFDLDTDGRPERIGWTSPSANDGFLGLDLDRNGIISDARELFGTAFRKRSGRSAHEGFDGMVDLYQSLGLQKGGLFDEADAVYPNMLLWFDRNHDGRCQSGEALRLPAAGLISVATAYRLIPREKRTHQSGNAFVALGSAHVRQRGVEFPREVAHIQFAR